ncbi:MAG: alkaline phosphatase family protein [Actinomycetota bacterium]
MRTRWKVLASIVSLSLMGLAAVAPTPATATPDRPTRVLIIILDQMRPDYVQRFDMRNVKGLMRGGVNFPRARLGHMAAETVISHNVITSGQFPKHMGWTNEVYRDVDDTLGGGAGAYYVSSSLSCDQFGSLITAQGYPKLEDYLGTGSSDGKFVAIGNKTTSSCPAGQPALDGVDNDIVIRLGSSATLDCDGDGTSESWRPPSGVNVPAYVSASCGRFYVNVSNPFGTDTTAPAWMYPADGARYIRGNDPKHLGGDVWAADAAIKVMRNDGDWDGMLVSMPAIDKTAHMWGTDDTGPSGVGDDIYPFAHLPRSAKIADRQVGKILGELESQGIADETLVVLTTDHAGQTANRFHGIDEAGRSNFNWYYGEDADETYLDPSPAIADLVAALGGNLDFSYQDGHIAVWLEDTAAAKMREAAQALADLPDVIATYSRTGAHYAERTRDLSATTPGERAWFRNNAQRLVNTMAAADGNGPDVVGLLRDDTSYGVMGDHGGHQRAIQRIPIVFDWPGLRAGAKPATRIRTVDILPTILRLMGIAADPSHPMDGRAVSVPLAP